MTSVKIVKKQEKDTVSEQIPITVHARNQKWTFHCDKHQPLANTMFIPFGENFTRKMYVALL